MVLHRKIMVFHLENHGFSFGKFYLLHGVCACLQRLCGCKPRCPEVMHRLSSLESRRQLRFFVGQLGNWPSQADWRFAFFAKAKSASRPLDFAVFGCWPEQIGTRPARRAQLGLSCCCWLSFATLPWRGLCRRHCIIRRRRRGRSRRCHYR